MTEYLIPTQASETEFTEKRSTFIGHVWPVETEDEARGRIDEMKKKYPVIFTSKPKRFKNLCT